MKHLFFSKSTDERADQINRVISNAISPVIYLYPKNLHRERISGVFCATYEEINQKNVWLHINDLVSDRTTIVLENPTRYPKITSPKFKHLQRLCMRCNHAHVYVVDLVPFTLTTEFLYSTCSYVGRDILGYPHYYAFRENYEEFHNGYIVHAHDPDLLASKLYSHVTIDYDRFSTQRKLIEYTSTTEEIDAYQTKRDNCFADETISPRKIITKLADLVHAHASRFEALHALIQCLSGSTVIYCNLSSYANRINRKLKTFGLTTQCQAISYQIGAAQLPHFDNVIYMESPIVKSYYLLDAEARHQNAQTYHICGDQKVDRYLYQAVSQEINEIDALTQELAKWR